MRTYKWTETIEHEQIEPEIGEVFEWNGMKLKCMVWQAGRHACQQCCFCKECGFVSTDVKTHPVCNGTLRIDGDSVFFVKYEEPKFTQEEAQEMYYKLSEMATMFNSWADSRRYSDKILSLSYAVYSSSIEQLLKEIKKK